LAWSVVCGVDVRRAPVAVEQPRDPVAVVDRVGLELAEVQRRRRRVRAGERLHANAVLAAERIPARLSIRGLADHEVGVVDVVGVAERVLDLTVRVALLGGRYPSSVYSPFFRT
jgi:hypothetical protein